MPFLNGFAYGAFLIKIFRILHSVYTNVTFLLHKSFFDNAFLRVHLQLIFPPNRAIRQAFFLLKHGFTIFGSTLILDDQN